jgi:hypothetical protein
MTNIDKPRQIYLVEPHMKKIGILLFLIIAGILIIVYYLVTYYYYTQMRFLILIRYSIRKS